MPGSASSTRHVMPHRSGLPISFAVNSSGFFSPGRLTVSAAGLAACETAAKKSSSLRMSRPANRTMRSPGRSPALGPASPARPTRQRLRRKPQHLRSNRLQAARPASRPGRESSYRFRGVSGTRGRSKRRRRRPVGQVVDDAEQHPGDFLHSLCVDELRQVAGAVIVVVHAGVKQQHGNVVLEQRIMIGVGFQLPGEVDLEAGVVVGCSAIAAIRSRFACQTESGGCRGAGRSCRGSARPRRVRWERSD